MLLTLGPSPQAVLLGCCKVRSQLLVGMKQEVLCESKTFSTSQQGSVLLLAGQPRLPPMLHTLSPGPWAVLVSCGKVRSQLLVCVEQEGLHDQHDFGCTGDQFVHGRSKARGVSSSGI